MMQRAAEKALDLMPSPTATVMPAKAAPVQAGVGAGVGGVRKAAPGRTQPADENGQLPTGDENAPPQTLRRDTVGIYMHALTHAHTCTHAHMHTHTHTHSRSLSRSLVHSLLADTQVECAGKCRRQSGAQDSVGGARR